MRLTVHSHANALRAKKALVHGKQPSIIGLGPDPSPQPSPPRGSRHDSFTEPPQRSPEPPAVHAERSASEVEARTGPALRLRSATLRVNGTPSMPRWTTPSRKAPPGNHKGCPYHFLVNLTCHIPGPARNTRAIKGIESLRASGQSCRPAGEAVCYFNSVKQAGVQGIGNEREFHALAPRRLQTETFPQTRIDQGRAFVCYSQQPHSLPYFVHRPKQRLSPPPPAKPQ